MSIHIEPTDDSLGYRVVDNPKAAKPAQPKREPISESTIARMAGNIAAGLTDGSGYFTSDLTKERIARAAVDIARAIAAEVERTRPAPKERD